MVEGVDDFVGKCGVCIVIALFGGAFDCVPIPPVKGDIGQGGGQDVVADLGEVLIVHAFNIGVWLIFF